MDGLRLLSGHLPPNRRASSGRPTRQCHDTGSIKLGVRPAERRQHSHSQVVEPKSALERGTVTLAHTTVDGLLALEFWET